MVRDTIRMEDKLPAGPFTCYSLTSCILNSAAVRDLETAFGEIDSLPRSADAVMGNSKGNKKERKRLSLHRSPLFGQILKAQLYTQAY